MWLAVSRRRCKNLFVRVCHLLPFLITPMIQILWGFAVFFQHAIRNKKSHVSNGA